MRALLLNLTRFGDLLQSQAVIHDLHEAGHEVGLVCLESFASSSIFLDNVSACFPLRGAAISAKLDTDWRIALGLLEQWKTDVLHAFPAERVINLTPAIHARLLGRTLAGASQLEGFGLDVYGFGSNQRLWTSFFEAASLQRETSPFNIVDLFRRSVGFGAKPARSALRPPDAATLASMRQRLASAHPKTGAPCGYVAFQLGASQKRRQWAVEHFVAVGDALYAELGMLPVLLGTQAEQDLAEKYCALSTHRINLVGQTTLPELGAVLTETSLLISNDTGTMHLAAGLGVPVLSIFLATAQPWDTGPYLEQCCCVEPDLPCHPCGFGEVCPHGEKCSESIAAELICFLALARLRDGVWPQQVPEASARIWLTHTQHDEHSGFWMDLRALSAHEQTKRTSWMRCQRYFLSQFLDKHDTALVQGATYEESSPPQSLCANFNAADRAALCVPLAQADALLSEITAHGVALLRGKKLAGQQFLSAVHQLSALLDAESSFKTLGRLWLVASQERGDSLHAVLFLVQNLQQCVRSLHRHMLSRS